MPTYLSAQCRLRGGGVSDIRVLDISEAGCMIEKRMLSLQPGERILIKLTGLAYMSATILWVEEDEAGVAFEQPLYGPVLTHLRHTANLY